MYERVNKYIYIYTIKQLIISKSVGKHMIACKCGGGAGQLFYFQIQLQNEMVNIADKPSFALEQRGDHPRAGGGPGGHPGVALLQHPPHRATRQQSAC